MRLPLARWLLATLIAALGAGCASSAPLSESGATRGSDGGGREADTATGATYGQERPRPETATTPATATPTTPPPAPPPDRPEDPNARPFATNPWPERAHGRDGGTASASGVAVRFDPPARREPREARRRLPDRPRVGLVVVRGGVIVHDPAVLLDLEGRLDGAMAAVVALEVDGRPSIGLEALAGLGRAAGLDLVLVDVRVEGSATPAAAARSREAWLVTTADLDLVGAFATPTDSGGAPPGGAGLVARIERAWIAIP